MSYDQPLDENQNPELVSGYRLPDGQAYQGFSDAWSAGDKLGAAKIITGNDLDADAQAAFLDLGIESAYITALKIRTGEELSKHVVLTPRLVAALDTAILGHNGQKRKGSATPYVVHPFGVAEIVANYTDDEDTIIAGLFHDVLEDVPEEVYSEADMQEEYGQTVVSRVKHVSEEKTSDDGQELPWRTRKMSYIEHLQSLQDPGALLVSAADKIHNLGSMIDDYHENGAGLWGKFKAPKEDQLWNYQTILDTLQTKPIPEGILMALVDKVSEFEAIVRE